MNEYLDNEGYPTEKILQIIEKWDVTKQSINELIALIETIWKWPDWGFIRKGKKLELHTGGWSGNEDIIYAMQKNFILWSLIWRVHKTGGHYYFEIKEIKKTVK